MRVVGRGGKRKLGRCCSEVENWSGLRIGFEFAALDIYFLFLVSTTSGFNVARVLKKCIKSRRNEAHLKYAKNIFVMCCNVVM